MSNILTDNVNKNASTTGGIGLENNELVQCMLLKRDIPSNCKKKWNEKEQKKKDEAETLGDLYEPVPATEKECGVSWLIAIIRRGITLDEFGEILNEGELVFKPKDGKIEIPKYRVTTQFQHLPPDKIETIESKNGVLYGNMFSKAGSDEISKNGKPVIANMYPSVYPVKENDPNIPWGDRVSADKIPLGQEDKYKTLLEKEQERKEAWREHINKYKNLDAEGIKEYYDTAISRRLMLCQINELAEENSTPEVFYHKPMPGMKFVCNITRSGKYFNPVVLATVKEGGKYVNVNYGTNQVRPPKDADKKVAEAILQAYDDYYTNLRTIAQKEIEDDEPNKF